MLRALGNRVEVQNYIDNTGVQVADVVVGFHYLEKKTPAEVQALIADPAGASIISAGTCTRARPRYYKEHPEALAVARRRRCTRSKRARATWPSWRTWSRTPSCRRTSKTMLRLGVEYDVLPRESEILHLQFWATAFELLKERKAIYSRPRARTRAAG